MVKFSENCVQQFANFMQFKIENSAGVCSQFNKVCTNFVLIIHVPQLCIAFHSPTPYSGHCVDAMKFSQYTGN